MPTSRRRHAVTETPPVQAALDELREAMGGATVALGELVVLGARAKLAEIRADANDGLHERRRALGGLIRRGELPVDRAAAEEVRRSGWVRT